MFLFTRETIRKREGYRPLIFVQFERSSNAGNDRFWYTPHTGTVNVTTAILVVDKI